MGRPADWSPLAGSDPVPGDPAGISAEAAHLSRVAEQIAGQVAVLRKIAGGQSDEKGQHAVKLRSAASDTAGQLEKVTGRYRETSAALNAWVPELEYAQAQSLKALSQAQEAHGRQRASQPIQRPPGTHLTPADHQEDQARSNALSQANADMAAAQAMLAAVMSHRDQAAARTASKIHGATSADADSWWDSFTNWVSQHAEVIEKIANVAGWVATVCGILSLAVGWIPVVGQVLAAALDTIATLATLVALGCHLMLALAGDGSWADVALDAFALVTLGMGRAFAKAAEGGYTAARAAGLAKVAGDVSKGDRTLAEADQAEKVIGFSAREARGVLKDAKASLQLPGWGKAVVKGLDPVQLTGDTAKGATEAVKGFGETGKSLSHVSWGDVASGVKSVAHDPVGTLRLGDARFGDAAVGKAAHAFGKVSDALPDVASHAGVQHWTNLAHSAQVRFFITTGAATGVDGFDKASGIVQHAPVLHQWNDLKDLATHKV